MTIYNGFLCYNKRPFYNKMLLKIIFCWFFLLKEGLWPFLFLSNVQAIHSYSKGQFQKYPVTTKNLPNSTYLSKANVNFQFYTMLTLTMFSFEGLNHCLFSVIFHPIPTFSFYLPRVWESYKLLGCITYNSEKYKLHTFVV